jgi:hypothetical protein
MKQYTNLKIDFQTQKLTNHLDFEKIYGNALIKLYALLSQVFSSDEGVNKYKVDLRDGSSDGDGPHVVPSFSRPSTKVASHVPRL